LNKWETHCIKKTTIQTAAKPTGWTMKRMRAKRKKRPKRGEKP